MIFQLCASALLALTLVLVLVPGRHGARARLLAPLFIAALFVSPGNLPAVAYIRGATGDLSVLLCCVMAGVSVRRLFGKTLIDEASRHWIVVWSVAAGLALYPSAFGLNAFELYRWGYVPVAMIGTVVVVGLAAWYFRAYWFVLSLTLALACYSFQIYESRNLWDYLVDPILVLFSVGFALRNTWDRVRGVQTSLPNVPTSA